MIHIPLIKLKKLFDEALNRIVGDLQEKITANLESESWLYRSFYGNEIDSYDFYVQLKSILLRGDNDPNKLQTRLLFNRSRMNNPTIHFNEPSDDSGEQDWIGMNTTSSIYEDASGDYSDKLGRSFTGTYELIVTSKNNYEVVAIYNLIKAILISLKSSLAYHFTKFSFSGKQLMDITNVAPFDIFFKSMQIRIDYDVSVPDITTIELENIDKVYFTGTPYPDESDVR